MKFLCDVRSPSPTPSSTLKKLSLRIVVLTYASPIARISYLHPTPPLLLVLVKKQKKCCESPNARPQTSSPSVMTPPTPAPSIKEWSSKNKCSIRALSSPPLRVSISCIHTYTDIHPADATSEVRTKKSKN